MFSYLCPQKRAPLCMSAVAVILHSRAEAACGAVCVIVIWRRIHLIFCWFKRLKTSSPLDLCTDLLGDGKWFR